MRSAVLTDRRSPGATTIREKRPPIACLLPVALALSTSAWALPPDARHPGGIARIDLAAATEPAPRAWLGERPVLVTAERGRWLALVGLALDLPPGAQDLRVVDGHGERTIAFTVGTKRYPEQRITLKDDRRVRLSPDDEARATREIAAIREFYRHWRADGPPVADLQLPAHGRLASRFGLRRFFNGEPRSPHVGLDFAVPRGTPITAAAPGKVLAVDDYFFNGKTVIIDHGQGLISLYCHLDRIDVRPGETVAGGARLGLSGMSGRASGPHLHWSVALNGVLVDPELFLVARKR